MLKITFSLHARERLKSRGIPEREVIHTICEPDKESGSFRSRQLYQRNYRGKILEAVTKEEKNEIIVITAYYLGEKK